MWDLRLKSLRDGMLDPLLNFALARVVRFLGALQSCLENLILVS